MLTKILLFLLVLSVLNVVREAFKFWQALRSETPNMTDRRLILLGVSLSYILTIIITGLTI